MYYWFVPAVGWRQVTEETVLWLARAFNDPTLRLEHEGEKLAFRIPPLETYLK